MSDYYDDSQCEKCGGVGQFIKERTLFSFSCSRCGCTVEAEFFTHDDRPGVRPFWETTERREGYGTYRLVPKDGSAVCWGRLPDGFQSEHLDKVFDMAIVAELYNPAASYIACFDPASKELTLLWGEAEPPMWQNRHWGRLSPGAREVWERLQPQLHLSQSDASLELLAEYCEACAACLAMRGKSVWELAAEPESRRANAEVLQKLIELEEDLSLPPEMRLRIIPAPAAVFGI